MYTIDYEYFDIIDNQDKAYALAWFWSRGLGRIQISRKDIDILRTLKVLLEYEGPIRIYDTKAELNITNPQFHASLARAGCVRSKREDQLLPIIPDELMSHFVRGIFDSYGNIEICKQKYPNITIVHNEEFASALRSYMRNMLEIETRHYYRYSHTTTVQILITRTDHAIKLMRWMYADGNYFLTRKFQKCRQYLEKSV